MPTPLTSADEMIVPIPILPQYKLKPHHVDSAEIRLEMKYQQLKEENRQAFIATGIILILLILGMVSSKSLYKYYERQKRQKEAEKHFKG